MSHTPTPWSIAQSSNPKNGTAWRDLRAVGDFGEMYIGEALDKDASHIVHCVNTYPQLVEALKEIAKGEGRFSRDPLEHAANTIEDMKQLALQALAAAEKGV